MTDLLNQLVSFIGDHPTLANFVVFMIAMGEALFVIGLVVPSTVVLVGAGTLVGLGKLEPAPIFVWTMLGAIAGDAISYWIGHIYKGRLKTVWPFSRYRALVERGEEFFLRHGGKSVFIGRFVPGVKAIVPGIAGMVGMNASRFTFINVTSAFFWTIAHLGPGFIAGTAFSAIGEVSGRLAAALGVLVAILFLAVIVGRWLILIVIPLFSGSRAALFAYLGRRSDRLSQWAAVAFNPEHPRSAGMLVSAFLLLVTIPAFGAIAAAISPGNALERADTAIRNLFLTLRSPLGDQIMVFITMLGDGVVITFTAAAITAYLFLRGAWRRGFGFLIAMAGAALFVPLFKLVFHRSRPIELYDGADAFSFPSGHATTTTVLIGIAAVLVAHDRSPLTKAGIFSVGIVYILAIAFSRIYLGAHWVSDVIGGLIFGTAMASAFAFIFGSIHNEKIGRWLLAAIVCVTIAFAGGFHIGRGFEAAEALYAPHQPQAIAMTMADWREDGWQNVPARRIELDGETEEPLVLQWAGSLAPLEAAMAPLGFERAPRWSLATLTGFLVGQTPAEDLPTLPRTHNGRAPAIVLIREDNVTNAKRGGRWVLRVWPTAYRLDDNGYAIPLYAGSLVHERVSYPLNELSTVRTDRDVPLEKDNPLLQLDGAAVKSRDGEIAVVLAGAPWP